MAYLLRRNEDGKFVAPPGSVKSYVTAPLKARQFKTRAEAAADACGNETIVECDQWINWSPISGAH